MTTTIGAGTGSRFHGWKGILVAALAAHAFFAAAWLVLLVRQGPRQNDWAQLHYAGRRFVSGEWSEIYTRPTGFEASGYYWRYPPYALYLVAPLAFVTPPVAYGLIAGAGVLSLVVSLGILKRLKPVRDVLPWVLAIALSAPALTTLITGQLSAVLLLSVAAAAAFWTRGHVAAAGAVLGLFALKPNLGAFLGLMLAARGEWRGLRAMAAVVAVLCLTTLPLGIGVWRDFVGVSFSLVDVTGSYKAYKLITLKGFLAGGLGNGLFSVAVWAVAAIVLTGVSVIAWRRPASVLTCLSQAVLLAIAANPYGFFYDALLLAFPATVWWWDRDRWRRGPWLTVGALIAIAWCWEHAAHTWIELFTLAGWRYTLPFSVVGPVAAAWLVLSLLESRRTVAAP